MRLVLERICGDFAILETEDGSSFQVKKSELPANVQVGTVFRLSFHLDPEGQKDLQNEIELLEEKIRRQICE